MANGDHDFVAAEVLTAANVDDYLMLQAVQKYATSAARDSALTSRKREGMVTYQDDTNTLTVYSGAAWSTIGPVHGAMTSWTPTVTQLGSVTVTNNVSRYQRIGRLVTCYLSLSVTGSGTANNAIIIGGLPFTAAGSTMIVGAGELKDASSSVVAQFHFNLESTTTLSLRDTSAGIVGDNRMGITGTAIATALASTDYIIGTFTYEVAADA